MTSAEAFLIIQQRLARWARVDGDQVLFVPDDALDQRSGQTIQAPRGAAFTLDDAERWRVYLDDQQSWLHANLLRTLGGDAVISLRRGPSVKKVAVGPDGLPFSINVSVETTPFEWISP